MSRVGQIADVINQDRTYDTFVLLHELSLGSPLQDTGQKFPYTLPTFPRLYRNGIMLANLSRFLTAASKYMHEYSPGVTWSQWDDYSVPFGSRKACFYPSPPQRARW